MKTITLKMELTQTERNVLRGLVGSLNRTEVGSAEPCSLLLRSITGTRISEHSNMWRLEIVIENFELGDLMGLPGQTYALEEWPRWLCGLIAKELT